MNLTRRWRRFAGWGIGRDGGVALAAALSTCSNIAAVDVGGESRHTRRVCPSHPVVSYLTFMAHVTGAGNAMGSKAGRALVDALGSSLTALDVSGACGQRHCCPSPT